jgi:NDP-sugar pyrophosphorylase family protein
MILAHSGSSLSIQESRMSPIAIVLAAGQGTRMKSDLPKVLFPVLGRPMIEFVLDALAAAGIERVIAVVGYRADDVQRALSRRRGIEYALQAERQWRYSPVILNGRPEKFILAVTVSFRLDK